jgi:hypothetical protein
LTPLAAMISFKTDGVPVRAPARSLFDSLNLIHRGGASASGRSSSVATDQKASIRVASSDQIPSAIENEISTYRAISVTAVFSVICGALSVFAFASPIFYVFSFLAIGLGIRALRLVRRHPDMLTGTGLATAGVVLGLGFGLTAGTISTVQHFVRLRQAERFSREVESCIRSPRMGELLWITRAPNLRRGKTMQDVEDEYEGIQSSQTSRSSFNMGPLGRLMLLRKRMAEFKDTKVRFIKIEAVGEDDYMGSPEVTVFANALFEVTGPTNAEFPEAHTYALAILRATSARARNEWWLDSLVYPYIPDSHVEPEKPGGEGHGHPHH